MRKELDDLLCERYPDLFCDRHTSPFESGMHYGFTCGDGWFELINSLCAAIPANVKAGTSPPVLARPGKSKKNWEGCASAFAVVMTKFAA